ncbi:beta-barrel fold lipoprotein [Maribacter polysaccharolyticus]|uniref:beta-barrel fold lipoprotein n=1 Tax=Maribacter polysaccharolyticus TaxID=3020831 RepID=UPI00237FBF2E|nr:hypothetical protein [Maribacter polysaccharolyticus]MDE3744027.1 hypothetical protein [Maribacter polysaccharolyticus]
MKKLILGLAAIISLNACSDNDSPSQEIDSGLFTINITQTGDYQSYRCIIAGNMTDSDFIDCSGQTQDLLVNYLLNDFESCSLKSTDKATQLSGSVRVGDMKIGLVTAGEMTLEIKIQLDGETIWERIIQQTEDGEPKIETFDLDPADY